MRNATSAIERRFELTATLGLDLLSEVAVQEYATRLEGALIETISGTPAVTAYFVEADPASREVVVGLRFEKVKVVGLEAWATEILDEAIAIADRIGGTKMHPELESSVLVPA